MIYLAGSGHPGGSLSIVEILSVLYFSGILKYRSDDPNWKERDRFVLSKGHAAPALYAVLSKAGFFKREILWTLRKLNSDLQGHPHNLSTPGVEVPTGSLGQGLSISHGIALGLKIADIQSRVFTVVGDGEIEEGNIWECIMSAGHYKTGNLTAIVDYNHLQIDGSLDVVKSPEPIEKKFIAFNWETENVNGHDIKALHSILSAKRNSNSKPLAVIAHTIKGKGISFMENQVNWHGVAPGEEEYKKALEELNA